jgi:serine/threonine-protein kinase
MTAGLSGIKFVCPFIAALAALVLASTTAQADGSTDQHRFIVAVRDNLPMYVIPGGHDATDDDVLAGGYEACAALDQYPTDSERATRLFYRGGNTVDGEITYDGHMFMLYAANYLCNRHAHLYENF